MDLQCRVADEPGSEPAAGKMNVAIEPCGGAYVVFVEAPHDLLER